MLSFAKVAPSFNFWFRCLIWETSKALIWLKSQKTFDVIIRISVSIAMRQRPNVFQWFILLVFLFIVKYIWKNTHTQLQSANALLFNFSIIKIVFIKLLTFFHSSLISCCLENLRKFISTKFILFFYSWK